MDPRIVSFSAGVIALCILWSCFATSAMTSISPCPPEAQDEMAQLYIQAVQSRGSDGSCDAACEQAYDLMDRRACELAASGVCYTCDPAVCAKYGIACGGTGEGSTNRPPGDDITWIVVVCAGALVAVGGAVAVSRGKKKEVPPQKTQAPVGKRAAEEKKKEKKEKTVYILQLSADAVRITKGSPAAVTITVWKQVGDSPPVPAPEAKISLALQPEEKGISIVPPEGQGKLQAAFQLKDQVSVTELSCIVTATAGESGTSAAIRITVEQDIRMEFY